MKPLPLDSPGNRDPNFLRNHSTHEIQNRKTTAILGSKKDIKPETATRHNTFRTTKIWIIRYYSKTLSRKIPQPSSSWRIEQQEERQTFQRMMSTLSFVQYYILEGKMTTYPFRVEAVIIKD